MRAPTFGRARAEMECATGCPHHCCQCAHAPHTCQVLVLHHHLLAYEFVQRGGAGPFGQSWHVSEIHVSNIKEKRVLNVMGRAVIGQVCRWWSVGGCFPQSWPQHPERMPMSRGTEFRNHRGWVVFMPLGPLLNPTQLTLWKMQPETFGWQQLPPP